MKKRTSNIILTVFILSSFLTLVQGCNCPLESCALTKDGKCYEPVPDREKRPVKEANADL